MNKYEERIKRMERHLSMHPTDYQAVIRMLKEKSNLIVARREKHRNLMRQRIAHFRKETREVR